MAEEEPGSTLRLLRLAMPQEGSERRDACARPDHDDWRCAVRREREAMCLLRVNFDACAGLEPIREIRGCATEPRSAASVIAHGIDRQVQLARRHEGGR